jgi:hypothetical protein
MARVADPSSEDICLCGAGQDVGTWERPGQRCYTHHPARCSLLALDCCRCLAAPRATPTQSAGSQRRNENLNPRTADAPLSRVLIGWTNGLLLQLPEVRGSGGILRFIALLCATAPRALAPAPGALAACNETRAIIGPRV